MVWWNKLLGGSKEIIMPKPNQLSCDTLMDTFELSAEVYERHTTFLNAGRDEQITLVPDTELAEQARDWVSDERLEAADKFLHRTIKKPPLLIPLPNIPVTKTEVAKVWESLREDIQGYDVSYGLETLVDWTDDEISGYEDKMDQSPVRFVIMEAAYPSRREGNRAKQLNALVQAQEECGLVRAATLFEGTFLAGRINGKGKHIYKDSLIRSIDLDKGKPSQANKRSLGNPAANLCMDGITTYVGYAPSYEVQASRRVIT